MPRKRIRSAVLRLMTLLAAALPAASLAADPGALRPLKILTLNFNSEEVVNDSDFFVRDLRFRGLKQWVLENDPDIILLQEAWTYHRDHSVSISLARAIGYDVSFQLEMGFLHLFDEADAVLTKKSLAVSEKRAIKLPHSAPELGNGKTWVIAFGAVSYAVKAKLKLPNGEPLYAYSTHLTGSSASDRADQANAIIDDARASAARDGVPWEQAHVIVGGDFNSAPDELAPLAMERAGFVDTFDAAHPGDPSCSLCEQPDQPWFNPFTIAPGQFPSQASDSDYDRIDYVFSHEPELKPIASTLTFTAPYRGVWMSDHYGVTSILAPVESYGVENPIHDYSGEIAPTVIQTVTSETLYGPGPLPPLYVNGPRGVSIENRSDIHIDIFMDGPGYIFSNSRASLDRGQQASFTFDTPGDYTYVIQNVAGPRHNPPQLQRSGVIHVESTGY
ncbi:MAG: endonuclease/exonuclease/phosphatase family protein [Oligoflexia bacterium]|nr:endonuclease/exonuclease/phosphatase family protein [Oligoflexia bacterium]